MPNHQPQLAEKRHRRFFNSSMLTALLLASITACSNQQIYTAVQERERQECAKLPQDQYEECMAEVDSSYDDYERARQEMKDDSAKKRVHTGS